MKLLTLTFFLATTAVFAQCDNYFFLQSQKTIEVAITDKKGKPNGKQLYKVQEVTKSGNVSSGAVSTELYNEKGKLQATNNMKVSCQAGMLNMDMRIFIPEEQSKQFNNATATTEEAYLEYPNSIKVGEKLKDGKIVMTIDNNGLKQKLTVIVSDRMVEAEEKVTTSAGSWDTFKVHYKTMVNVETMGIPVKINIEGTEWYAPGFGSVKTLSKYGTTEVISMK